MITYLAKQTVSFFFQPLQEINGIKTLLPFTGYAVGTAIDGTHGNLKCVLTIETSASTQAVPVYASTVDGLSCQAITMFGYNTDTAITASSNSAVITLAKGFTADTYSFTLWYDSSGGTLNERILEQGQFIVTTGQIPNPDPPNTP